MASNSVADHRHSTVQTTNGMSIPTRPIAGTSSILNNAQNTSINHSTFVTTIKGDIGSLEALYSRVAPNAILNAGGRADEVKCHPGTRKEVIGCIEKWRADAQNGKTGSRIFWLSGPAGAGKSAIVQTVAESWSSRGIHAANFFFFRSDTSRNHARSLVATLLYQIFDFYPEAREAVDMILTTKPRILESSLQEQFDKLICFPLRSIGQRFLRPIVLLIDGLDECDSEQKTSQQQILQLLDVLVSHHDLSFLVLVASRVEHQIDMAFRDLSSAVESTFLHEDYQSQKDIHLFVTAEFDRIKRTHRLAPSDACWPSASDVDGIVAKSSGQFIFAATVMRFISDSPADPKLSLQKVQGAARIGNKSPFSQLDALYSYILGQADDQDALKDILHTAFFVLSVKGSDNYDGLLMKCLKIQDDRYTDSVINSCVADVAAVAHLDGYGQLIFYHASLADYLKDQARSAAYFIDKDAFNLKMVPLLFKHQYNQIAYDCMLRLKILTLEVLRAYNTQDSDGAFCYHEGEIPEDLMISMHNLCVRHNTVAEYKLFLYKWLTHRTDIHCLDGKRPPGIPYIQRYMTMVQIDRRFGDAMRNPEVVVSILRPESASDGREIALWLQNLLTLIYIRYHCYHLTTYKQRLRWWTSWAVSNNVPFSNLHNVPEGRYCTDYGVKVQDIPFGLRYIIMARIDHINGDLRQDPDIVLDALRGESASDIKEMTLWLQCLLQGIKREYYTHCLETYKQLIREWISWANSNEIPFSATLRSSSNKPPRFKLEDLPYGQIYLAMTQIDALCGNIWQNSDITVDVLRPQSASGAEEVGLWILDLLRSIHAKFHSDDLNTYKRLIRRWTSWAVLNNIPLSALQQRSKNDLASVNWEDIPYGRMYLTMAQIDSLSGDILQDSNIVIDTLRPESTSDAEEVALWIRNLLRSIMAKFYPDDLKTYKRLVGQWIIWAVSNNIPLVGLDDVPDAQRQIFMDTMKKWAATPSKLQPDKGVITY